MKTLYRGASQSPYTEGVQCYFPDIKLTILVALYETLLHMCINQLFTCGV